MTTGLCRALLIAAVLAALPTTAFAQRRLHWETLLVSAHLNADGSLSVTEDHTIVFNGDWNGGERTFDMRPRQSLSFHSMERRVGATWQAMTPSAALANVDDYALTDAHTLRWRSRLPTDPIFDRAARRYALHYSLSRILLTDGTQYTLDHDFAFPDREGAVDHYELRLTLDAAWQPETPLREVYTATDLPPGRGFVLTLPLRYVGRGVPVANDTSRPPAVRIAVQSIAGVALFAILWVFVSERAKGRFTPIDTSHVDDGWLREHILAYPAEVVAAAWDDNITHNEVVTLLARLAAEGTLESPESGSGMSPNVDFVLKVDRTSLSGYERDLIDKLFFDNKTTTSTKDVKAYYRNTGLDPVSTIRSGLEARVRDVLPFREASPVPLIGSGLALLLAVLLLGSAWMAGELGLLSIVVMLAVTLGLAFLASIAGFVYRTRMDLGYSAALAALIPPVAVAAGTMAFLWFYVGAGYAEWSSTKVGGVAALGLCATLAGINAIRSRQTRAGVESRKRLTTARLYFMSELGKPDPALDDDWYPWVVAFDLTPRMDEWFVAHGRANDSRVPRTTTRSRSGSGSTSRSSWSGFGGGGSGGAGASASWASAVGSFAAGVPKPGSSGSSSVGSGSGGRRSGGGGSSSRGSSGGGGGGGW